MTKRYRGPVTEWSRHEVEMSLLKDQNKNLQQRLDGREQEEQSQAPPPTRWIKCIQTLKNPNPLSLMEGLMCLLLMRCFRIGYGVDYLCKSTLDWIQNLSILKPFELKVFFKLSEKQLVILSKQPIVLYLGILRKVENCFWWLTCYQTKTTDWFEHSIDCLFSNHNRKLFCALTEL